MLFAQFDLVLLIHHGTMAADVANFIHQDTMAIDVALLIHYCYYYSIFINIIIYSFLLLFKSTIIINHPLLLIYHYY
jgi:hypothetical protein